MNIRYTEFQNNKFENNLERASYEREIMDYVGIEELKTNQFVEYDLCLCVVYTILLCDYVFITNSSFKVIDKWEYHLNQINNVGANI